MREKLTLRNIILVIIVLFLLATIPLTLKLVQQRQQVRSKAAADAANLAFASQAITHDNSSNTFDVAVSLDVGAASNPARITGGTFKITVPSSGGAPVKIVRFSPDTSKDHFNQMLKTDVDPSGTFVRYAAVNTADQNSLPTDQFIPLGIVTLQATGAGGSGSVAFTEVQFVASGYRDAIPVNVSPVTVTITTGPGPTGAPTTAPTPGAVRGDVTGPTGHPDKCLSELDRNYIVNLWQNNNYDALADLKSPPDGHFIVQEDVNIWDNIYLLDIADRCH